MFQHMRDAAGAAGQVKIQERTEQGPTQAWPWAMAVSTSLIDAIPWLTR